MTYKAALRQLLIELEKMGWQVQRMHRSKFKPLKVPYATKGNRRLWFKAQSVYITESESNHDFKNARSTHKTHKDFLKIINNRLNKGA